MREVRTVEIRDEVRRADGTPFRPRCQADDRPVDRPSSARIVPVLRPLFLDRPSGLANVLEVSAAQVFVLLDVEPEIYDIFCAFSLQEETV